MAANVSLPEGFELDQPAAAPQARVALPEGFELDQPSSGGQSIGADVLKSFGTGVGEGLIGGAGSIGSARSAASSGLDWLGSQLGASPQQVQGFKQYMQGAIPGGNLIAAAPTIEQLGKSVQDVTGPFYQPQTTGGEIARTAGQFAPGLAGGTTGLARRAISEVALPALASESAGQLFKGTDVEPVARAVGGLAGGFAGPAATAVGRKAITPFPVSGERAAMLNTLQSEGVQVPASMATGSKALKAAESQLGGESYSEAVNNMNQQYTAAVLRKAGINAPAATPEAINAARDQIGSVFDTVAANNKRIPVPGFHTAADAIAGDYQRITGNESPALKDIFSKVGPWIDGDSYQAIQSQIGRDARATSSPELRSALYDTKSALDAAVQNNLKNPADAQAWKQARQQWFNLLTIEKAAGGPAEGAAYGLISPNKLSAAIDSMKRGAYVRGQGDFAELARAGNAIMKPLQDSGTTSRFSQVAKVAGIGGGLVAGGIPGLITASAIAASPWLAGKALMSGPGQAYLKNQARAVAPRRGALGTFGIAPSLLQGQRQ